MMDEMSCAVDTSATLSTPPPIPQSNYYPESPQFVGDEVQYSYYDMIQEQERRRKYMDVAAHQQQQQQPQAHQYAAAAAAAAAATTTTTTATGNAYYPSHYHNGYFCDYEYAPPPVKRVTFAEDAYLYSGDVTQEEVKASWCTAEDFRKFKNERKDALKRMKSTGLDIDRLESEGYAMRGLEPYFNTETNKAIKAARKKATACVLSEQQRQRSLGICDEELLSLLSNQDTKWAREVALRLAADDQQEARKYQAECRPQPQLQPHHYYHPSRNVPMPTATQQMEVTIDSHLREEFAHCTALHRERSNRSLRLEDCEFDDDEERRTSALMNKLQTSLRIADDHSSTAGYDRY